jgi:hypothetical protein
MRSSGPVSAVCVRVCIFSAPIHTPTPPVLEADPKFELQPVLVLRFAAMRRYATPLPMTTRSSALQHNPAGQGVDGRAGIKLDSAVYTSGPTTRRRTQQRCMTLLQFSLGGELRVACCEGLCASELCCDKFVCGCHCAAGQ